MLIREFVIVAAWVWRNVERVWEVRDRACREDEVGRWVRIWRRSSGGIVRSVGGDDGGEVMGDMSWMVLRLC